jgi:hypothetical protein
MFARNVSLRLKPNTLSEFTKTLEKDVLPILRKQPGFCDEITLAFEGGNRCDRNLCGTAWNTPRPTTQLQYPEVLMRLDNVLDGPPNVRVSTVNQFYCSQNCRRHSRLNGSPLSGRRHGPSPTFGGCVNRIESCATYAGHYSSRHDDDPGRIAPAHNCGAGKR